MPYIGNASANRFVASKAATQFSGDGSTTAFTLDHSVASDEDILVSVDGVIQEPSVAYAVSSGTTLTFTAAPSTNSGNNIFVYYLFRTVGTVDHPATSALTATSGTFSTDLTVDTDTLKVDSTNDQVGINTTAMSSYYAKDLVISAANQGGITLVGATDDTGQYLMFADGTSGADRYRGYIQYSHSTNNMSIATNGTTRLLIDSNGHVTNTFQPAFSVNKGGTDQSSFAVGSDVVITFSTEVFDNNSDFASNTFTAPVTGKYFLSASLRLGSFDTASSYYILFLATSNRTYRTIIDPNFTADLVYFTQTITVVADMDANDTCTLAINQGSGSQQTDINGNAEYTYFTGYLLG